MQARTTDLHSMNHLREATTRPAVQPFHVGIVIGPGFIPMDMVGIQTVYGLMPGAQIHLIWKNTELVEGFPSWWTRPTTTFAQCPDLDVISVPMMMAPEAQTDPELVAFVAEKASKAKYVIGICNGVVTLGAAGLLKGRRATISLNSLEMLPELGVKEVVPSGSVVVDGNLYTAGPGCGSFEAALLAAAAAFGRPMAELAELIIEYNPKAPFGKGTVETAAPEHVAAFTSMMRPLIAKYRAGAVAAYEQRQQENR
ncbi:MAG: DJ-1/PfpI family protein [Gammaproteobacteria bacterium]|nr:DJ-1/PfpI family protein [Gammaproteobacteria bacterium]